MNNITEKVVNFNELEEKIFKIVCKMGCMILKNILEIQDTMIRHKRDKKRYRNKKRELTSIKTMMGAVEYYHTVYYDTEKETDKASKKTISLLTEFLNIKKYGQVSMNVVSMIVTAICKLSYRKVAETISDLTNLDISAMGVWDIVQEYGEEIRKTEDRLIKEYLNEAIESGTKEITILYSETDGININLQGKDKRNALEKFKKENPDKDPPRRFKREIKVAMVYESMDTSTRRHRLEEKEIFAGNMSVKRLKNLVNTFVKIKYGAVKVRLLNADGAAWTNKVSDEKTIKQLDAYHIIEKINDKVCLDEDRKEFRELFYKEKFNEMIERCDTLKVEYSFEETECSKLEELKHYLMNNYKNLKRAKNRAEVKKVLKENEKALPMGYQESNNYSTITQRMKRQRMSFSIRGADNLTAILSTIKSSRKSMIISSINTNTLPIQLIESADEYIARIEENVKNLKEKAKKQKEVHELPGGNIFNIGLFDREVEQRLKEMILV